MSNWVAKNDSNLHCFMIKRSNDNQEGELEYSIVFVNKKLTFFHNSKKIKEIDDFEGFWIGKNGKSILINNNNTDYIYISEGRVLKFKTESPIISFVSDDDSGIMEDIAFTDKFTYLFNDYVLSEDYLWKMKKTEIKESDKKTVSEAYKNYELAKRVKNTTTVLSNIYLSINLDEDSDEDESDNNEEDESDEDE